ACSEDEARGKYSRLHRLERTYTWIIEQILVARNVGAQLLLKAGQRSVALGGRREIVCTVEEHCRSHQRAQVSSARGNGAAPLCAAGGTHAEGERLPKPVPWARVAPRPSNGEHLFFQCGGKRMFWAQLIIEDERQVTRSGKLHPELAMGGWAAEGPSTA